MSGKKTTKNAVNNKDVSEPTVEEIYKKKTLHRHILDLPDTYIGSVEQDTLLLYVYDSEQQRIIKKTVKIVPGLYKIVDEILVNAADNTVRDQSCNIIKIYYNQQTGIISVKNNGGTIPIEKHKEENMYVPEMIFGNLLTSGNYDQKNKIVGGKNGLGSKLVSVYSEQFEVDITDAKRNLHYYQKFYENMFKKDEPVITKIKKATDSWTSITFKPDYKRFGLDGLTDDMCSLIARRAYDIAGTTNSRVRVYLNEELLPVHTFEQYIHLFLKEDENGEVNDKNLIYSEVVANRWSVGVLYDNTSEFQHMTFVNNIATFMGGTHLDYITNQVVDKIKNIVQDKHKNLKIKPAQIKENITVFINSVIEDPSFSSQTKDCLTTKASTFQVKCELDDKFIAKIGKTGLIDEIVQVAQVKQLAELEKTDAKKNQSLRHLTKLDDARWAGTRKSSQCRLILTEGDSAKTFALSGLDIIGREKYGTMPLRGKLLNVRDATPKQLLANEEIKNIKQILGLKQNAKYTDTKKLRYGGVILLCDSDVDGFHIKGLLMNFFHYFWPSLLKIPDFIQTLATPIIKAFKHSDTKRKNPTIFYTLSEFKEWEKKNDTKNYDIKYYKGLGTSTKDEAKESFIDFDKKVVSYMWDLNQKLNENKVEAKLEDEQSSSSEQNDNYSLDNSSVHSSDDSEHAEKNDKSYQAITLAFAKNRANDRKEWLKEYNPEIINDNNKKQIPIYDFVHKDLIHFSNYDNIRSIPDIADGLKPSQRKIMYGVFKRKLDKEVKVAQLSGYISEHSGYHHGEASLQGAIINMAQDFCGSNNINLLKPNGNFGTRRVGGKDSASPRYIFTQIGDLTKDIFIDYDNAILKYNIEDGDTVEPEKYYPVIPMILVNGSQGIGTGYSTTIPSFNPLDLVENIKLYLNKEDISKNELVPWYKGFNGVIRKTADDTYTTYGKYNIVDENTIKVTELPVGVWTDDYLEYLNSLAEENKLVTNFINNSGVDRVDITITFVNNGLQQLIKSDQIEKKLKLTNSIKTSNMHLYKNNMIVKYKTAISILEDYMKLRLNMYDERKKYVLRVLENELQILKYRKLFIESILNKTMVIERKARTLIIEELKQKKYPELSHSLDGTPSYSYLTDLPLFSLTQDKIDEYNRQYNEKKEEHDTYKKMTIEQLWLNELGVFEKKYTKWLHSSEEKTKLEDNKKSKLVKKKK